MQKRESASWLLGLVATIAALVSGWLAYHAVFAKEQDVQAGLGAVYLFLKSQNQNAQNFYESEIEKGRNVEANEARLQGLQYEEQYIDGTQKALGVTPKDE